MRISDWSSDVCSSDLRVPIVITSLGARTDVNDAVHGWGGVTFHDVINRQFAAKAAEKGADGLIVVAAGAGGHAGIQSAFALGRKSVVSGTSVSVRVDLGGRVIITTKLL